MNIKLDVEESYRQPLIDFFANRQKEIFAAIEKLNQELNGVNSALDKLIIGEAETDPTKPISEAISVNGYHSAWPWIVKCKYVINRLGRPATTSEIADTIINFEPKLERTKVVGNVSAIVTSTAGQKHFTRQKNLNNQNVFSVKT